MMRGLSGLELFLSAQMCLLICWVRAASAVDFRGGFRTWRWMAVLLLAASLLLLTGASSILMHGLAALLQPLMGTLEAAKPALLVVPAGACLAFVLRYLIPDMGRCRAAQAMLVFAVVIMIGRVIFGLRTTFSVEAPVLAILDLLTSGLVLSAFQLHCRYVIHVNPNPPTAVKRILRAVKPAATPSLESPTGEVGGLITAMPPVEAVNVVSVPVAATEINIVKQQPEQKCSGHDPVMETRQPDHRTEGLSSGKDRGRGKLSKKQLRRAG